MNGIAKLTASDTVKNFFIVKMLRGCHLEHTEELLNQKAVFLHIKKISPDLKTVKNALDVLILQDLEATMKTDKSSDYYIVSKDNDFDGFIDEKLKKKSIKSKRIFLRFAKLRHLRIVKVNQNSNSSANKSKDTNARQKKTDIEAASKKKRASNPFTYW